MHLSTTCSRIYHTDPESEKGASDHRVFRGKEEQVRDGRGYFEVCVPVLELPESQGEKELLSDILDSLSYIKKDSRNQRIIGLQLVTRKFIEQISNELHVDLNRDFVFYENLVNHLESFLQRSLISLRETIFSDRS